MKMISKFICSISILSLFACSSSSPEAGSGPGFPADMTAKKLFLLITVNLYVPDPLSGDETYSDGTANCTNGGKANVADTKSGNLENSTITYTNCESQYGANNIALKQNGTVDYFLTTSDITNPIDATFFYRHELSYSGDIGFSADCEFAVTNASNKINQIDGACTYKDSKGKVLSLNGAEMLEAVQAE